MFKREVGMDRISIFRGGGWWEKGGDLFQGLQFLHINKLKSEIFNDKKGLYAKMFFSVTTKYLNWEILIKNLINFKRWNGVKDEKI